MASSQRILLLACALAVCLAVAAHRGDKHHGATTTKGTGTCVVTDAEKKLVFTADGAKAKSVKNKKWMHTMMTGKVTSCTSNGVDVTDCAALIMTSYPDDWKFTETTTTGKNTVHVEGDDKDSGDDADEVPVAMASCMTKTKAT